MISKLQAHHQRLDTIQYLLNKQMITEYHNKQRQISKDALDSYNARVDRAKEIQHDLQIYNSQGKFVNKVSQIPRGKTVDILIK